MDLVYHLGGLDFEWDEDKARTNWLKHGVTFEEAAEVFLDPLGVESDASVPDEQRDQIMGYSFANRLLLVVYTERRPRTRIISARRATRAERKQYAASQP